MAAFPPGDAVARLSAVKLPIGFAARLLARGARRLLPRTTSPPAAGSDDRARPRPEEQP